MQADMEHVPVAFLEPLWRDLCASLPPAAPAAPAVPAAMPSYGDAEVARIRHLCVSRVEAIDRQEFVRLYAVGAILLEHATMFPELQNRNRDKTVQAFFSYVLAAENLGEACQRVAHFNLFLAERGHHSSLEVSAGSAIFSVRVMPSVDRPPAALVVSIALLFFNLFSWLTGRRLGLGRVEFPLYMEGHVNPGLALFGAPVSYRGAHISFVFPARLLEQKIWRTKQELEREAAFIAYDPLLFVRRHDPDAILARIRDWLGQLASSGDPLPDSARIANQLGISRATLFRQLRAGGTSWLALKQNAQQDLSFALLAEGTLDICEVARRAGFQTARSFRRAFLGWAGVSPSEFRQRCQKDRMAGSP